MPGNGQVTDITHGALAVGKNFFWAPFLRIPEIQMGALINMDVSSFPAPFFKKPVGP